MDFGLLAIRIVFLMLTSLNVGSDSGTNVTTVSNTFLNIQSRFFFSQRILITIYNGGSIWVELETTYTTVWLGIWNQEKGSDWGKVSIVWKLLVFLLTFWPKIAEGRWGMLFWSAHFDSDKWRSCKISFLEKLLKL